MNPTLPQNDSNAGKRQSQLEESRETYKWAHDWPVGVATLETLPKSENYSLSYVLKVLGVYAEIGLNYAELALDGLERGEIAKMIVERFTVPDAQALKKHIFESPRDFAKSIAMRRPDSWKEYGEFFQVWDAPEIKAKYDEGAGATDRAFAWQRVAGCNPFVLARATAVPEKLALSASLYASQMPGDTLEAALAEHRLYLADYAALDGIATGETDGVAKFIAAPIGVFAVAPKTKTLLPIAVQLGQKPDAGIVTPQDDWHWRMAMELVQIADANMHEGIFHLGRTHMVMEVVGISMHRNLADAHPLHVLLRAHIETTFAINHSAKTSLIAPGGTVDRCFAPQIDAFGTVVKQALDTYPIDQASPLEDLVRRGLDDSDALPNHPYRDDAKLIWEAIGAYVSDYIDLYYTSAADVTGDSELQDFVRALGSEEGGRLPGIAAMDSVEALKKLFTQILWIAGPGHSAVNFPQYPFMGYVPNMPGASYSPIPTLDSPNDEQTYAEMLPPMRIALEGVTMIYLLSNARDSTFGHYAPFYFRDRRVGPIVRKLQGRLEEIEDVLEERDAMRFLSYPFLRPSQILQSISI